MSARCSTILLASIGVVFMHAPALAQHVVRRGGEPILRGDVSEITDNGVTVRSDLGAVHVVSWDRVRDVVSPEHDHVVRRYWADAVSLWRARTRVERNDTALAEPVFERLFAKNMGKTHETALVIAEGLLRCRLARGEHHLAVLPWLETVRLRRAGIETRSYAQLPTVLDAETLLCTRLPPIWIDSPLGLRASQEVLDYNPQGDDLVAALAQQYAAMMILGQGRALPESLAGASMPAHDGVELLQRLRGLVAGDSAQRRDLRERFGNTAAQMPPFARAWMRFFTGLSLLSETGVVRNQRGVTQLLYLPAIHSAQQPYLTGLALSLAAAELEASGNPKPAEALRADLVRRFPYHPVIGAAVNVPRRTAPAEAAPAS